jgi:cystathionine beta-lyase/cystathionine gamma-synthase
MRNERPQDRTTPPIRAESEPESGHGEVKPPTYPSMTYVHRSAGHAKEVQRIFFEEGGPERAGPTFSVVLKGGEAEAFRMLNALRPLRLAVSPGGTETLICHFASTTHYNVPAERRRAAGIAEGTMRFSPGIEHIDDLLGDLAQALDSV